MRRVSKAAERRAASSTPATGSRRASAKASGGLILNGPGASSEGSAWELIRQHAQDMAAPEAAMPWQHGAQRLTPETLARSMHTPAAIWANTAAMATHRFMTFRRLTRIITQSSTRRQAAGGGGGGLRAEVKARS